MDKWCLVVRLGGVGDHLIVSSVLPRLKEQGWKIAYMSQVPTHVVNEANPYIDRHIVIGREGIAKEEFVSFFQVQRRSYDRVLNFSETIERTLLLSEDQLQFWWEPELIRELCGQSYLEVAHNFARVGKPYDPRFFPTQEEDDELSAYIEGWGGKVVGVQVAGSNFDKLNPNLPEIVAKILLNTDAKVMLLSGSSKRDQALCEGIIETVRHWTGSLMRIRNSTNKHIRWSLGFAKKCHLLIGPDSGLMWAGAMEPQPKIVLLSHASPENITKHWKNTTTFHADESVGCWPCHKLHYGPATCTLDARTKAAACITSINPDAVVRTAIQHLQRSN